MLETFQVEVDQIKASEENYNILVNKNKTLNEEIVKYEKAIARKQDKLTELSPKKPVESRMEEQLLKLNQQIATM